MNPVNPISKLYYYHAENPMKDEIGLAGLVLLRKFTIQNAKKHN
jgi:hypothetical protein